MEVHHTLLSLLLAVLLSAPHPTGAFNYEWIPPGTVCDSVHDYTPPRFDGVPPPLPKLPDQYSMNIQANILQKAWSSDVTEHYDGPNNRATVFLTFNGTTTQTIFNYKTMETYDVFPDGSCKARSGQADVFGFYKMDRNHRPIKSTVYEMFHMGPKQNFTYVGNTWVRGIRVNHWTSCQEWSDFSAKFQLDYYFSHEDYQTAWGTGQIPIRAVVNGSAGNEDQNKHPMFGRHKFEHIYDFTAFNVGPIQDETVFHLPHDVVCTGRKDFKSLPNIPDNFQMDMEMNCPVMGHSMPLQHSLRYDWDHRMVETFMNIPSPQGSIDELKKKMMDQHMNGGGDGLAAGGMSLDKMVMRAMSTIDDHNSGLRYVTEKMNNTCRVTAMPKEKDAVPMDHGKALFNIQKGQKTGNSPFSYQGRSTFRNIPVDVWGIDNDGMIQKVFFLADDREPMVIKDGEDSSNRWSSGGWNSNGDQDGQKKPTQGGKPNGPAPNGETTNERSKRNAETTGRPNGPAQNGGRPNRPNPTGASGGQDSMQDAKEQAKQKAKEEAKERAKEKAKQAAKERIKEEAKEKAKEKAKENNRPPGVAAPTMSPAMQKAMERMLQAQGGENGNKNLTDLTNQEMVEMIKKRREQKAKQNDDNDNSGVGGPVTMKKPRTPFPIIVGMVFRNRTAISTRNMPAFFQEVMTPELLNWKEQMAKEYLDGVSTSQKSEGANILDQHAKMEQMHSKAMRHAGEMDMNVFKFQPLHTDETMFQVAQCYDPEQTSHVLLHVPTSFQNDVIGNQAAFSIAMRKGIAEAMGVSYIQISNLKPEPHVDTEKNIDATYVSFSLLGSPPVTAPKMKQPSISEAKRKLVQSIMNGISFKVNYPTHTKSFMVDKSHYSLDRRIFMSPGARKAAAASPQTGGQSSSDADSYSSASVAGIAIATLLLGIVVAVAVVVLLHKRRHPEEPVIPYKITKT